MTTRLEQLRYDREWSRAQLSDESGVAVETIRGIEELGRKPRVGTAVKLASALKVPASEILAPPIERAAA